MMYLKSTQVVFLQKAKYPYMAYLEQNIFPLQKDKYPDMTYLEHIVSSSKWQISLHDVPWTYFCFPKDK